MKKKSKLLSTMLQNKQDVRWQSGEEILRFFLQIKEKYDRVSCNIVINYPVIPAKAGI